MAQHVSIKEKITAAVEKITPNRKSHGGGTSDRSPDTRYGATDATPVTGTTATGAPVYSSTGPVAPVSGAIGAAAVGSGTAATGLQDILGQVIDQETFTCTEDHERLVEKKRYELEHHPVQKEYVVETKYVGEREIPGAPTEVAGQERHVVGETVKEAPAGDRVLLVENVDLPASEMPRGSGTGVAGASTGTAGATVGAPGTGVGEVPR